MSPTQRTGSVRPDGQTTGDVHYARPSGGTSWYRAADFQLTHGQTPLAAETTAPVPPPSGAASYGALTLSSATTHITYDLAGNQKSYDYTVANQFTAAYNGDGQILQRRDGTVSGSTFAAASGATTAHPNAQAPQHEVYAAGHRLAGLSESSFINVRDGLTGFSNTRSGTQSYRVQAGNTLQSIAQRVYGNGALWYVIDDANALSASPTAVTLTPGLSRGH